MDPLTVTFATNSTDGTTETAMILAVDDDIAENAETFTVSIDSTDPPCASATPSSQPATIVASDRKSEYS